MPKAAGAPPLPKAAGAPPLPKAASAPSSSNTIQAYAASVAAADGPANEPEPPNDRAVFFTTRALEYRKGSHHFDRRCQAFLNAKYRVVEGTLAQAEEARLKPCKLCIDYPGQ